MSKTLTVLVPLYNESAYITRCLDNVIHAPIHPWKLQIITVDDGSDDNSPELLRDFQKKHPIQIVEMKSNQGKGAAIRAGMQKATGDVVLIQDADLEYDPNDFDALLSRYEDEEVQVVYGSRILGSKKYHNYHSNVFFYLGGITLTALINVLFHTELTDQPTGYKSWRKELSSGILKRCTSNGFEFEVELTAFFSQKTTIHEVPIHYYPRTKNHGKKITLTDFFKSVFTAVRWRFNR